MKEEYYFSTSALKKRLFCFNFRPRAEKRLFSPVAAGSKKSIGTCYFARFDVFQPNKPENYSTEYHSKISGSSFCFPNLIADISLKSLVFYILTPSKLQFIPNQLLKKLNLELLHRNGRKNPFYCGHAGQVQQRSRARHSGSLPGERRQSGSRRFIALSGAGEQRIKGGSVTFSSRSVNFLVREKGGWGLDFGFLGCRK